MSLHIYTDGSCRGNGKQDAVGAWGFVAIDKNEQEIWSDHGVTVGTTNQRMEMKAVYYACVWATIHTDNENIYIYTDSAYIHNCLTQKWYENWENNGWLNSKKEPVANKDLWIDLLPFFKDVRFNFTKVPGHQNGKTTHSYWNNYIDRIVQNTTADVINGNPKK